MRVTDAVARRIERITTCPGCHRMVEPSFGPNGEACPRCGTTWQRKRADLLKVVAGGRARARRTV